MRPGGPVCATGFEMFDMNHFFCVDERWLESAVTNRGLDCRYRARLDCEPLRSDAPQAPILMINSCLVVHWTAEYRCLIWFEMRAPYSSER